MQCGMLGLIDLAHAATSNDRFESVFACDEPPNVASHGWLGNRRHSIIRKRFFRGIDGLFRNTFGRFGNDAIPTTHVHDDLVGRHRGTGIHGLFRDTFGRFGNDAIAATHVHDDLFGRRRKPRGPALIVGNGWFGELFAIAFVVVLRHNDSPSKSSPTANMPVAANLVSTLSARPSQPPMDT